MRTNRPSNGFTLIELLVVVAIISLLVSILLPSLTKAKVLAKAAVCASNQRSMFLVQQMYAQDNGRYAPACDINIVAANRIEPYAGTELICDYWAPAGTQYNYAPFLCPFEEPAVITTAAHGATPPTIPGNYRPFGWNVYLGYKDAFRNYPSLSLGDITQPSNTVGWADDYRHGMIFKPDEPYFTLMKIHLRHGQDDAYLASELFTDDSLTTSNTATSAFLDGHCEVLNAEAVLEEDIYDPLQ